MHYLLETPLLLPGLMAVMLCLRMALPSHRTWRDPHSTPALGVCIFELPQDVSRGSTLGDDLGSAPGFRDTAFTGGCHSSAETPNERHAGASGLSGSDVNRGRSKEISWGEILPPRNVSEMR